MKKGIIWGCLMMLILMGSGCSAKSDMENTKKPNPVQPNRFVTRQELYSFLGSTKTAAGSTGRIVGAVSPHHLTAGSMIAAVIEKIAEQKPRVIIIVGPNHNNEGARILTGFYDWQGPDGVVKTEQTIVQTLLTNNVAACNEEILSHEHSIGSLVPFIGHYLPEARIVPIILQHGVSRNELDELLATLEQFLADDVVILASIDFSHYLPRQEAYERDKVTLQAMQEGDIARIYGMNSEYLDSPASLALVLARARQAGVQGFKVLDHSNSGDILGNDLIETTSYFTLLMQTE